MKKLNGSNPYDGYYQNNFINFSKSWKNGLITLYETFMTTTLEWGSHGIWINEVEKPNLLNKDVLTSLIEKIFARLNHDSRERSYY